MKTFEDLSRHRAATPHLHVRDLCPLMVRAGFLPHDIHCFSHKFGLNTFRRVYGPRAGEGLRRTPAIIES